MFVFLPPLPLGEEGRGGEDSEGRTPPLSSTPANQCPQTPPETAVTTPFSAVIFF
jgi:hypothetical protein